MFVVFFCSNNIQDKIECGLCQEVFTDIALFLKHREMETFFIRREAAIRKTGKERRSSEVGGSELTSQAVRATLAGAAPLTASFDADSNCCVCRTYEPPNFSCIDDDDEDQIGWLGCDRCTHWVHIGLCVPAHESGEFLCPCCLVEE